MRFFHVFSCALFLLVLTKPSLPIVDVNTSEVSNAFSASYNISAIEYDSPGEVISPQAVRDPREKTLRPTLAVDAKLHFAEALSQNSGISDGLHDTGQTPVIISLVDTPTLDLEVTTETNAPNIFSNKTKVERTTDKFEIDDSSENDSIGHTNGDIQNEAASKDVNQPTPKQQEPLIVKAIPVEEAMPEWESSHNEEMEVLQREFSNVVETDMNTLENSTSVIENVDTIKETPEEIPSFSEWAQKQLEEAEKQDTVLNHSTQTSHSNINVNNKNFKLRSKNYASPACGAKIVAVNPEAGSANSILSPNRDEYMLNTCNSRIWFVVELCEPIQAQKIDLGNFELFSSSPKDLVISLSDRFPTRDWTSVGQFAAKDERDVQTFDLYPHLFGKFIKVEMLSHHGSEHYCPISMFKVYGTSEFEVLEKENSLHAHTTLVDDDDDDDILEQVQNVPPTQANLFGSARDAVMSIMKKAAQVLVKSGEVKHVLNGTGTVQVNEHCATPSHIIVCDNCSDSMYNEVFDLMSCERHDLKHVMDNSFVYKTLRDTDVCDQYGLDFKSKRTGCLKNETSSYLSVMFMPSHVAALCNTLAIEEQKVVLNTSYQTDLNVTSNLTIDLQTKMAVKENNLDHIVQQPFFKDESKGENIDLKTEPYVAPDMLNPNVDASDSIIRDMDIDDIKTAKTPIEDEVLTNTPEISEKVETDMKIEVVNDSNKEIDNIEHQNIIASKHYQETVTQSSQEDLAGISPTITEVTDKKEETDTLTPQDDKPYPDVGIPAILDDSSTTEAAHIENFLSDDEQIMTNPASQAATMNAANNQGPPQAQKESVFLRLSNRVKTLERNMSLSGQYLEELSRRYKKQVEEMQRTFEKTISALTEEKKRTEEREQRASEQTIIIQQQLTQLNTIVSSILLDRDSWFGNISFLKFLLYQTIIITIVIYFIRRNSVNNNNVEVVEITTAKKNKNKRVQRRKSVEGVSGHVTPSSKQRRPSEEAVHIVRKSANTEEDDDVVDFDGEWIVARGNNKNRKRKTSIIHRKNALGSTDENEVSTFKPRNLKAWERQDSIGILQETPIPLDDTEFVAPCADPVDFSKIGEKAINKKEFPKTNGSIIPNANKNDKAKPVKGRRLSSPAFFRTALNRSTRSTPSPNTPSIEENNGKIKTKNVDYLRVSSESPTGSCSWSSGDINFSENVCDSSDKKNPINSKKRSFKSIFKKVF